MQLYRSFTISVSVLCIHIYIVGVIVKQLRCEKLPQLDDVEARFTDIAVVGDMLLTTQNRSNEILVIKLNW